MAERSIVNSNTSFSNPHCQLYFDCLSTQFPCLPNAHCYPIPIACLMPIAALCPLLLHAHCCLMPIPAQYSLLPYAYCYLPGLVALLPVHTNSISALNFNTLYCLLTACPLPMQCPLPAQCPLIAAHAHCYLMPIACLIPILG